VGASVIQRPMDSIKSAHLNSVIGSVDITATLREEWYVQEARGAEAAIETIPVVLFPTHLRSKVRRVCIVTCTWSRQLGLVIKQY
jgi:hypothetical protein